MRRIVGRIEIDGDAASVATQPLGMTRDYTLGQRYAHAIKGLRPNGVFKPRQRRLRSQIETCHRIAVQQHLVNRIGGQPGRVVGIWITAGDREHALRE